MISEFIKEQNGWFSVEYKLYETSVKFIKILKRNLINAGSRILANDQYLRVEKVNKYLQKL